jgi:hypothetical protein
MSAANFNPYVAAVAAAYGRLLKVRREGSPFVPSDTIDLAWRDLAEDSVERAAGIRLLLNVEETADPEPYGDAFQMVADIARGRFIVSTAHCEHPIWTPAENVAFRIVHDVLGHYAASVANGWHPDTEHAAFTVAGFDWYGEVAACNAHVRLLPTEAARKALFTECLAQTAYAIVCGGFGPQEVGFTGCYLPEPVHSQYVEFTNRKAS